PKMAIFNEKIGIKKLQESFINYRLIQTHIPEPEQKITNIEELVKRKKHQDRHQSYTVFVFIGENLTVILSKDDYLNEYEELLYYEYEQYSTQLVLTKINDCLNKEITGLTSSLFFSNIGSNIKQRPPGRLLNRNKMSLGSRVDSYVLSASKYNFVFIVNPDLKFPLVKGIQVERLDFESSRKEIYDCFELIQHKYKVNIPSYFSIDQQEKIDLPEEPEFDQPNYSTLPEIRWVVGCDRNWSKFTHLLILEIKESKIFFVTDSNFGEAETVSIENLYLSLEAAIDKIKDENIERLNLKNNPEIKAEYRSEKPVAVSTSDLSFVHPQVEVEVVPIHEKYFDLEITLNFVKNAFQENIFDFDKTPAKSLRDEIYEFTNLSSCSGLCRAFIWACFYIQEKINLNS
ncbi:MAG: hypothetical protein AAFW70_11305, partial [Cyanobacteria bacterium J06635_10]